MIVTTTNAAQSIAARNAVFQVIPRALVNSILSKAKQVSLGKDKTIEEKRGSALKWFADQGADESRVLAALGRRGREDLTVDDLISLRGMATAIKEGMTSLDEALGGTGYKSEPGQKTRRSDVLDKAKAEPVAKDGAKK